MVLPESLPVRYCVLATFAALLSGCAPFGLRPPGDQAELQAAVGAAQRVRVAGPAEVMLADKTVLAVQSGLTFIPPAEGELLLRAIGQRWRANLLGVVVISGSDVAKVAAIYAKDRHPAIPELEVVGWSRAPALLVFRRE